MRNFKYTKKKAFTLIETLVAISILTIALTGPLAVIAQALRSSYFARDQITAYYLAQEAIEYIRNRRDINGLKGVDAVTAEDWLKDVAYDPADSATSLVNPYTAAGESDQIKADLTRTSTGYTLTRCASECPPLKINPTYSEDVPTSESLYGDFNSTVDSIFTREVIFSEPAPYNDPPDETRIAPAEREVVITVRVKWTSPSGQSSVTLREHLTNWQLEKLPPEVI
ncbi:MAG: prepilin-type N-terminal cleavage/methylation domain-containing protein [Candidatus Taylorbacteria bacterium]|nr:prepilin-type N-terminal cleavage/methylation domain-containing protein [Candidatus Taylorbacteria bacterium]